MTDEQIIMALAYCVSTKSCEECPICNTDNCGFVLMRNAFDLIIRQQAEIEDLKADKEALINGQETLQKNLPKVIRAEAIKEFAERLKELSVCGTIREYSYANNISYMLEDMVSEGIDNLVIEMTEERK